MANFKDHPAANVAAVVTLPAAAGTTNRIDTLEWSYDADPTGGNITITAGGATIWAIDITQGGAGFYRFENGLNAKQNVEVVVTLAAGGAGIVGKINVQTR